MEFLSAHHVTSQRFYQRLQEPACTTYPVRQSRAIQLHSFSGVDLGLAIQRKMVTILRDQYMREQPRPSHTTLQRAAWRRGLHDALTTRTCQLHSNVPDHDEALGYALQHLGDVLSQLAQLSAAVRAGFLLRGLGAHFSGQVRWQRLPYRSSHGLHAGDWFGHRRNRLSIVHL